MPLVTPLVGGGTGRPKFVTTVAPSLSGGGHVGEEITCNHGSYTPTPDNYLYQWLADGLPISGEDEDTFTPGEEYEGAEISCLVYPQSLISGRAVATESDVITVLHGAVWTARAGGATSQWNKVASNGLGVLVAIANSGTNGNRTMRSTDGGQTWAPVAAASASNWQSVCYGNGRFVACGTSPSGAQNTDIMFSTDQGLTWTHATTTPNNNGHMDVVYGGGNFVVVSLNGTGNRSMYSTDGGVTWTDSTGAPDNIWNAVAFGNGVFVAVAESGTNRTMRSTDGGATWTAVAAAFASKWVKIAYGNGRFVAVAIEALVANAIMVSDDLGLTWAKKTAPAANDWRGIAYGAATWVAVSATGTGNRVMTSVDNGDTWVSHNAANDYNWQDVCWDATAELFCAVANSAQANCAMTAP